MADIFQEFNGDWAVITTHTGKVIGRICEENEKEITVQPAFEYIPRLVQQGSGLGKDVIVLPYDLFTSLYSKMRIRGVSTIIYFNEMADTDKEQYQKITRQGADIAAQSKALKAGITLASTMPKIK